MSVPDKIPITLLTGFLGSGKTVLLNALLQQPALADSAVVVNEFGEIGLDHLLVASAKENIVLLDAGCLCCAVLGSLKETLLDLQSRRARGDVPFFRRVLVETTGLADPGPIIQSIMRDSVVSHFYQLGGLVCVVDAIHAKAQLAEHPEAQAQVAYADRIVITKTDRTAATVPAGLRALLRTLNPGADLVVASFGQVAAEALLPPARQADALPWLGRLAPPEHAHGGGPHAHGPVHDPKIGSESFWIDTPVTWSGLAAWIEVMRRRYGRDLLRCKGIVSIAGRPVVVHGVQTLFDTRRLAAWPDDERRSRLVLIGGGLERRALETSLRWLSAPEGTQPPLDPSATPPEAADQPANLVESAFDAA